jgi:hypothetical protein
MTTKVYEGELKAAHRELSRVVGTRVYLQRCTRTERDLKQEFLAEMEAVWNSACNLADDLTEAEGEQRKLLVEQEGRWVTLHNGRRVKIDEDGKILMGFGMGRSIKDLEKPAGSDKAEAPAGGESGKEAKSAPAEPLFSPKEMAMPVETPRQTATTKESLFAQAAKVKPSFDRALNTGQGVDKELGGVAIRPENAEQFTAALQREGPVVIIAGLKGEKRSEEKVNSKYGGDWSRLNDVIRATVAVDGQNDIPKALDAIRKHMSNLGWSFACAPEDRMTVALPSGYRDITLKMKSSEGHIAELQVNLKSMIIAKNGPGHKLYEIQRSIVSKSQLEKREKTPAEIEAIQKLDQEMKKIYDKAWAGAA